MKHKKKPYYQRKPFKRKTGGPKYMVGSNSAPHSTTNSVKAENILHNLLSVIGFNLHRKGGQR